MSQFVFYWIALVLYILSSICYIGGLTFRKDTWRRAGFFLALLGLLIHSVSLGSRWAQVGHGPYISTYEILNSDVWVGVLFFLLFQGWKRSFSNIGAVVMPICFIAMGFALLGSTEAKNLTPTLRSGWLIVHIIFAKLTVASLVVAVAFAFFYIRQSFWPSERNQGFLARLPGPGTLDDYSYRLMAFGFITLTIMIITGSIWANNSWGSYWDWDPTETWSLVVWFVYGIYLHGRITFRWQGKIASWYCIAAFIFSIVAFFIIPYFVKSLHSQYMVG